MKKTLLLAFGLSSAASTSFANLTAYENFDFPTGQNLNGQTNTNADFGGAWVDGGSGGGANWVTTTGLTYNGLEASGGAIAYTGTNGGNYTAYRELDAGENTFDGNPEWVSFLFDIPTNSADVNFFFANSGNPQSTIQTIGIKSGGLSLGGTVTGSTSNESFDSGANLIIARIDKDYGGDNPLTIDVWLNPTDLTDETSLGTVSLTASNLNSSGNGANLAWDSMGIRNNFFTGVVVDEVRLGTSLEAVAPIPEPSSYALISGALALGWIMVRRRPALS